MSVSAPAPPSSRLGRLHPELIDMIVAELGPMANISALRMTCRTLAACVARSPTMRDCLSRKTVELTVRDLEAFIALTGEESMVVHHLQHLTIKGIARNKTAVYRNNYHLIPPPVHPNQFEDPEQDQDTLLRNVPVEDPEDHERLLAAAFANVKKYGRPDGLTSLTLTVGPSTKPRPVYIVPRHKRGEGSYPEEVDVAIGPPVLAYSAHRGNTPVPRDGNDDDDGEDGGDGIYVEPYEVPYRPSWRSVWDTTERTFSTVMHALTTAQLPVTEELDAFCSVVGCAMPYNTFFSLLRQHESLGPIFSSLQRLKVHLSLRHQSAAEAHRYGLTPEGRIRSLRDFDMNADAVRRAMQAQLSVSNANGAAQTRAIHNVLRTIAAPAGLARIMPALEAVSVDWYNLGDITIVNDEDLVPASRQLTPDDKPAPALHLRSLELRGMQIGGTEILEALDTARPEHLYLCNMRFSRSSFQPVLRYLTDPDLRDPAKAKALTDLDHRLAGLGPTSVRSFELDDIIDGFDLVHYAVPGQPKFHYRNMTDLGPSTLVRPSNAVSTMGPRPELVVLDEYDLRNLIDGHGDETIPGPSQPGSDSPVSTVPVDDPPGGVKVCRIGRQVPADSAYRFWLRRKSQLYGEPPLSYDLPLMNPDMMPDQRQKQIMVAKMIQQSRYQQRFGRP